MDNAVWVCGVCYSFHPASWSAFNEPVKGSRNAALPAVNLQGRPWAKVDCFLGKINDCPEKWGSHSWASHRGLWHWCWDLEFFSYLEAESWPEKPESARCNIWQSVQDVLWTTGNKAWWCSFHISLSCPLKTCASVSAVLLNWCSAEKLTCH